MQCGSQLPLAILRSSIASRSWLPHWRAACQTHFRAGSSQCCNSLSNIVLVIVLESRIVRLHCYSLLENVAGKKDGKNAKAEGSDKNDENAKAKGDKNDENASVDSAKEALQELAEAG